MESSIALNQPSLIETSKFVRLSLWSPLPARPNQPLRIRAELIERNWRPLLDTSSVLSLQCVWTYPERHSVGPKKGDWEVRERREILFCKKYPLHSDTLPFSPPRRYSSGGPDGPDSAVDVPLFQYRSHGRQEQHMGQQAHKKVEPLSTRSAGQDTASTSELDSDHSYAALDTHSLHRRHPPVVAEQHAIPDSHLSSTPSWQPSPSSLSSHWPAIFAPGVLPTDWEEQRDMGVGLFGGCNIAIPSCYTNGHAIMPTFQETVESLEGRSGSLRCQIRWYITFRSGFGDPEIKMEIPVIVAPPRLPGIRLDFLRSSEQSGARLLLSRHGDVSWITASRSDSLVAESRETANELPQYHRISTSTETRRLFVPITLRIVPPNSQDRTCISKTDHVLFRFVRTMTVLPPSLTTDTLDLSNGERLVISTPNASQIPLKWSVIEAEKAMYAGDMRLEGGVYVFRCDLLADAGGGKRPTVQTRRLICQYHVECTIDGSSELANSLKRAAPLVLRITVPPRSGSQGTVSEPGSGYVDVPPLDDNEKLALLLYHFDV